MALQPNGGLDEAVLAAKPRCQREPVICLGQSIKSAKAAPWRQQGTWLTDKSFSQTVETAARQPKPAFAGDEPLGIPGLRR